jgi:hypothetical protein
VAAAAAAAVAVAVAHRQVATVALPRTVSRLFANVVVRYTLPCPPVFTTVGVALVVVAVPFLPAAPAHRQDADAATLIARELHPP